MRRARDNRRVRVLRLPLRRMLSFKDLIARRPWQGIRVQLTLALALTALLPALVLALLQGHRLGTLARAADAQQIEATERLAAEVGHFVEMHRRVIEAAAVQISQTGNTNRQQLDAILSAMHRQFPGFINMYVANAQAVTLAFYPEFNAAGESMVGVDFSDRWHFAALQREARTFISPVMKGRGGTERQLVTIVSPYFNAQGGMAGFVLGALDLARIGEIASGHAYGPGAYAVIVDALGQAIYHPAFDVEASPATLSAEPVFAAMRGSAQGALSHQSRLVHEDVFSTYRSLSEPDWLVWVSRPIAIRDAALREAWTNGFALVGAVLLLTGLIAARVSRRLTRAVHRLVAHTRRIRRNNFALSRDLAHEDKQPREWRLLLSNFHEMAGEVRAARDRLLAANQELEQRVEERTASLHRRQEELAAINALLAPIRAGQDATELTSRSLDAFRALLGLETLSLILSPARPSPNAIAIEFGARHCGWLLPTGANSSQPALRDSLARLARSLAVVLENERLYRASARQHALLNAILESMREAFLLLDGRAQVLYANRAMSELLGRSAQDLRHNSAEDLLPLAQRVGLVAVEEWAALLGGAAQRVVLSRETAQGRHHYAATSFEVLDERDSPLGRGVLVRDITREAQVERLKSSLISLAAHEFKTPVTSLRMHVETLLRADAGWSEEFRAELLADMLEDSARLQALIDDWLDASRIEAGMLRVHAETIALAPVIEQALRAVRRTSEFDCSVELADEARQVCADPARLGQVLVNLISNAVRYSDGRPQLRITARRLEGAHEIAIADHGIGIAAEHLEVIFEKFHQVDMGLARRAGGTGLGLAISRGIVEAHGGHMRVDSEVGVGSTFRFTLPDPPEHDDSDPHPDH